MTSLPAPAAIDMPVNDTEPVPIVFAPAVPQDAVPVGAQLTPGARMVTPDGSGSLKLRFVAFDGPALVTTIRAESP